MGDRPCEEYSCVIVRNIYKLVGFNGCIGSSDVTNIGMMKYAN